MPTRSPYAPAPTNESPPGFRGQPVKHRVAATLAPVFGRGQHSQARDAAAGGEPGAPGVPGGKGHPTRKRREAEAARKAALKPARTRREALKRDRQAMRAERQRSRQALVSGDERNMPPRDAGPVRKFARDFVDSRRSAAEFFFWIAIVVLVGSFVPSASVRGGVTMFWLVALIAIVVDTGVLAVRLRAQLRQRFPDPSTTRGATVYAVMRAMQIRRLRLPPPKVKPGATV